MAGQALALVPAGIGGAGGSQELHGLTHAAAAGGSEGNHGLAGEIGALQKSLDDAGRLIPPDGKADNNYHWTFYFLPASVFPYRRHNTFLDIAEHSAWYTARNHTQ